MPRFLTAEVKPFVFGALLPKRNRTNALPYKSRTDLFSLIQTWGARDPGRAVGV